MSVIAWMGVLLSSSILHAQQLADEATSGQASPERSSSISPRPSAFASDLTVAPHVDPVTPRSNVTSNLPKSATPSKEQPAGWVRRVVSEWLHRGNRSESTGSFFSRLRQEERSVGDSLIVSRCRSLLVADAAVRSHFIHIAADRGVITLRGNVPTESLRRQAEQLARNTVGMVDLRNELTVGSSSPIEQASYASASLAMPTRLDGGDLSSSMPFAPPESTPAFRSAPEIALGGFAGSASAKLGRSIEPVGTSFASPDGVPAMSVAMMPKIRHQTLEQQVAKPASQPEVLPSGQRVFAGTGRKATIPAPPSSISAPTLATHVSPPSPAPVLGSVDRLDEQKSADIAALLANDPRARSLTFTLRGKEVRLAGSVVKPEDLFALADLVDALPGIDFVSFDEVEFQAP
jgi:hypothetical protein